MSQLEDAIRNACAGGRLHGLTIFHRAGTYQANARWASSLGWTVYHDDDPVAALTGALAGVSNYDPTAGHPVTSTPSTPPTPPTEEPQSAGVFD